MTKSTSPNRDFFLCRVVTKQINLPDSSELIDGPNDELPGKPSTEFVINRSTGEIEGFDSPLGNFSIPVIMQIGEKESDFLYYAPPIAGTVPVLHINIYDNVPGSPAMMQALLGRLVFTGTCE